MPTPAEGTCSICGKPAAFQLEVTHKPLCMACYKRILLKRIREAVKHCSSESSIISIDLPPDAVKPFLTLKGHVKCSIILATANALARLLLASYLTPQHACGKTARHTLTQSNPTYPFAKTSREEVRSILTIQPDQLACDPRVETLLTHLLQHDAEATLRSLAKSFQQIQPGEPIPDPALEALKILRENKENA